MRSFEVGAARPDAAIFRAALDTPGLPAEETLMVGDRGAWDGAATGVGMTAPILPAPTPPDEARSGRVLDPVLPVRRA